MGMLSDGRSLNRNGCVAKAGVAAMVSILKVELL